MILYYLAIVGSFFLSFFKREKIVDITFFSFLIIFICFGYMTGSDWDGYEVFYYKGFLTKLVEPGYMLLSNSFSAVGINFWVFHIAIKVICFIIIFNTIMNREENSYFAVMIYLASFGFYLFIDCPFRSLIAVSVSLLAIQYIETKKWLKYSVITLLAMSIHITSIVLIPVYFSRIISRIRTRTLIIIFVLVYLFLFLGGIEIILNLIDGIFPSLYKRLNFYLDKSVSKSSLLSPGLIFRVVILVFMSVYRLRLEKHFIRCELVFNLTYIYLILSLVTYAFPLFFRMALFLSPFYVIMFAMISKELNITSMIIFKFGFFMVALLITWATITGKPYYIPYTNVLENVIKGEYPEFEYRKNYNLEKSPYRKD